MKDEKIRNVLFFTKFILVGLIAYVIYFVLLYFINKYDLDPLLNFLVIMLIGFGYRWAVIEKVSSSYYYKNNYNLRYTVPAITFFICLTLELILKHIK